MGGMSIWHWVIVLVVVILLFGTKKLPTLGSDIGRAIRGFKKSMNDDDENPKLEADKDENAARREAAREASKDRAP